MSSKISGARSYKARSAARLAAVQALFQIEQRGAQASTIIVEFLERRLGHSFDESLEDKDMIMPNSTFFSELVRGAASEMSDIDVIIQAHLSDDWQLDRIESVLRAILRVGIFEIKSVASTPVAVIINEYLDIARAFYDKKEVAFVNTVLDQVAKKIRPQASDEKAAAEEAPAS